MFLVARLGVLLLTVAAAGAVVIGGRRPGPGRAGSFFLMLSTAGGALALGVLGWAFLTEDWRFATVVGHARPDVPFTLRLAAIWAGPEGSLLLWTTMLALAAWVAGSLSDSSVAARLLGATTAAYGVVVATVADPFERLAAPPGAGNGLQPVLEHPAMLWHPPVLYLGLIGLILVSALAVGGSGGRLDPTLSWIVPVALGLLTAGLATGANWAYVELGWGGYWAWDPIENAGLVAWLAGGALLHRLGSPASDEPAPPAPRSVLLVAAVPGVAAVWATTITRTGVLNSVHAFADRPTLRLMLLTIAAVFTAAVTGRVLLGDRVDGTGPPSAPSARSLAGFAVVGLAAVVVAVGTYEPALEMLVRDDTFVVSGRFYSLLLWPVAVGGGLLRVRAAVRTERPNRVLIAAVVGAVVAMVVVTAGAGAAGLALAAAGGAVAGSAFIDGRSFERRGSAVAHLGIGLLLVGVAGTTAATTETVAVLTDAEATTSIGSVTHRGVEIVDGNGTRRAVATLDVTTDGRTRTFQPSLVSYVATGGESAEVDTDRGWLADTQVVLMDADADRATYRISHQPRIALVWLGSALTTMGLMATAVGRRPAVPSSVAPPASRTM